MEEDVEFGTPFVGREEHLKELENAWKMHVIFGIFGVRAVGKSRLVQEFLKRKSELLGLKRGTNLIQIDLKMFETTVESLIQLVYSSLGLMPNTEAIRKSRWKEDIVNEVRKKLAENHLLTLVFDNAEDVLDTDKEVHDQFLSLCVLLVKHCRGIKIIVTSTTKFLFTQIRKVFFQLELPPMTKPEVIQLLRRVATDVKFGDFEEPIAEQCEGLPQLAIMTAYELSEDGKMIQPEDMFELLLEQKLRALSRDFYPKEDRIADIYLSFLERLPEEHQRRLATLNYIPGSFNASEARDILDYKNVALAKSQALVPIRRRFLLNYDPETGRFNIQGILRNCMDNYFKWVQLPAVRKRYCQVFTKVMKEVCQEMGTVEYVSALSKFSAEQPNLQKLLTEVIYCEEETYKFFIEVAGSCTSLLERFFLKESERFYKGCLDLAIKYGDKKDQAKVHVAVGSLFTNGKGEFSEGEESYRQALDVLKDDESQELALVNQQMGWVLYKQGRHNESLSYLESSRQISRKIGLESSDLSLRTLTSLGAVNNALGKFERAKHYHFKALKWRLKTLGSCHSAVGASFNNIGLICNEMGNREQALMLFEKGLEVKRNSKADLKSVVYSMNNVSNQYSLLRQFDKAENMLLDALKKLTEDPNHPKDALALSYDTLGKVYLAQKKFAEAEKVLEMAIEIRQEIMPHSVAYAESLMHLAQAAFGLDRVAYARLFVDKVLELKAVCAEEMPQCTIILESLELLVDIHCQQGNADKEKETLLEQKGELVRLLNFYEASQCLFKWEDMNKKLETCQRRIDYLKSSFNTNKVRGELNDIAINKQEMKGQDSGNGVSEVHLRNPSGQKNKLPIKAVGDKTIQPFLEVDKLSSRRMKEMKSLPSLPPSFDNVQNDLQSNSESLKTHKETENNDYFENFCRCTDYRNTSKFQKAIVSVNIDVEESNLNTNNERFSFCSECGRHSFTDNTTVDSSIIDQSGNENLIDVPKTNIPDLDSLLDNQSDDKEEIRINNSNNVRGHCLNDLVKSSRAIQTTCFCTQCEIISSANRHKQ